MSNAGISQTGADETAAAFRFVSTEMGARVKASNVRLAEQLAERLETAGRREGRQAKRLAGAVELAFAGTEASVTVGGTRRVFRRTKAQAFLVLPGSEFGSLSGHGFKRWRGRGDGGYWVNPTVDRMDQPVDEEMGEMLDEMLDDWVDF